LRIAGKLAGALDSREGERVNQRTYLQPFDSFSPHLRRNQAL
jgi:hypothetical protein